MPVFGAVQKRSERSNLLSQVADAVEVGNGLGGKHLTKILASADFEKADCTHSARPEKSAAGVVVSGNNP